MTLHEKLTHWKVRESQERLDIFPCCWTKFILSQENFDETATQASLKSTISSQLELLHAKLVHYFNVESMAQLEQNVWILSVTIFKGISLSYFVWRK